ncbi:D-alanyl-D-alanine carboxypeptidase [Spirulina subsalsa FACHB-351]|uniref:D-alanyl-D-alanine carboxypeptidase n=1 Tax=Spirulina subsalsa FACHB-351 TaxID=234711 RepID=A0ABT3LB65_9CYAN|nr:D-alanyl-D-alanine carboxypeptidase [Spirulina subsalsa]MCW6038748.1 D-alanyl-D-alanine carboxypeptidase [Spirulina subsalsa FACHB-351]
MLKPIALLGAAGAFLGVLNFLSPPPQIEEVLAWEQTPFFQLPSEPDAQAEQIVQQYLNDLAARGIAANRQGVWLQSDMTRLAVRRGQDPMSAASLTKIATTIAALETWSPDYRFETRVYSTGPIREGVLQGDLVIEGSGDPFFIWEEAIALGNALNQLGLKRVEGNLIVVGKFYMNYRTNPNVTSQLLLQSFNSQHWQGEIVTQYSLMAPGTPRPQIDLRGRIITQSQLPSNSPTLLLRHQSVTLAEILKQMNIYSNNMMSEALAESIGGADEVMRIASEITQVPPQEIQLINGSGLGVANRISPYASVAMLMALERQLADNSLGVGDLFPVEGRDTEGTMKTRNFPPHTLIKTGTLASVSALAGVLPTRDRGLVWFAIINEGGDILELRRQQDILLQRLSQAWGVAPLPLSDQNKTPEKIGDPSRILSEF